MYTNADGITNKMDEIKMRVMKFNPEVIGICETKLNQDIGDEDFPKNYRVIRNDRNTGEGGGVCIMVKEDLTLRCCMELNNYETGIIQHTWCEINTVKNTKNVIIGIVYRPPSSKEEDDKKLIKLLQQVEETTQKQQLLVLGDFNYKDINWRIGQAPENTEHLSFLQATNDHLVLTFEIFVEALQKISEGANYRDYSRADYAQIKKEINKVAWNEELRNKSMNEGYTFFLEKYNEIVEKLVPWKIVTRSQKEHMPWLNKTVKKAIRERDLSWKKWRDQRNEQHWKQYQIKRNLACKAKRLAKQTVEKKIIEKIKENKNQFYNYIKGKTKRKTGIGAIQGVDGILTTNDYEAAEILNQAFQSVFIKNQEGYPMGPTNKTERKPTENNFKSITKEEINKAITKLKEGKAVGPDNISSTFILRCGVEILEPLYVLFNKSLERGQIPDAWRQANVIPIHKKRT